MWCSIDELSWTLHGQSASCPVQLIHTSAFSCIAPLLNVQISSLLQVHVWKQLKKSWTSNLSFQLLTAGWALTLHTWAGTGTGMFFHLFSDYPVYQAWATHGNRKCLSHWYRGFAVRKNICSIPPVFHAEWECVSSSRGLSSYYNKTIITTKPRLNTGIQGFHVYKTKTLHHKSSVCYFHFFSIESENNPDHVTMMPDLFSKLGHWDHEQKAWRSEVYHLWVSHWDRVKLDTIGLHHGKVRRYTCN